MRKAPHLVLMLILAGLTGACASTGAAVPRPFPMPGSTAKAPAGGETADAVPGAVTPAPPATPAASPAHTDGYAVTSTALALRGTPYRNGGIAPETGFDCSGFTQYVFHQHGLSLPREVRDQYEAGKKVKPEDLKVGDLIFFSTTGPGPTHVAIAIGGDQFIHAPSSTGVVRIERLSSSYWSTRLLSVRRVL